MSISVLLRSVQFIKQYILSLLSMTLAGISNAAMDVVSFRYEKSLFSLFEKPEYFNPAISWQNKWAFDGTQMIYGQERFWGSSRWFVALTDFWHLEKSAMIFFICLTAVTVCFETQNKKIKVGEMTALFIAYHLCFTGGFTIFFDVLFLK